MTLLLAFIVSFQVLGDEILMEAEEAVGFGVVVDTTRAGYSGSGYVTGFDEPGDSLTFSFTSQAHVYEVRIRYALNPRIKPYVLRIDGDLINGTFLGSGGVFKEKTITEIRLAEGTHTIVFSANVDIDYLRLVPEHHPPPLPPPRRLSDPLAGPATQALFDFLVDQYGRHILAGQQGGRVNQRQAMLEDIAYVRQVTGKDPAVGVFDLISYSRSRIERGEDPQNSVERWLDWAADDALVSLSWHWNAPTDLIDQPGREWWSGFYTRATTFDLAGALADTTSQRFQLLLGDIDAIAAQLHKFQDANVPILWRPLHEAWGEWFWWGARGPEAFVELWRLLYHRLVNVHALHNLIWVYTHHDAFLHWYPGDAFVDIVSRDIYKDDPSSVFIPEWRATQDDFAGRKMVALSESGTLPDPAVSTDFGVWWSWFSVWNGSRIRSIEPEHLRYVYGHEYVITRDELPVWRTVGLEEYVEVPRSTDPMEVYPNPTSSSATLLIDLPVAGDVRIEVYDQLGRVVLSRHDGWHPPGTLRRQIHVGMAPGLYFVRVLAVSRSFGARLVVAR